VPFDPVRQTSGKFLKAPTTDTSQSTFAARVLTALPPLQVGDAAAGAVGLPGTVLLPLDVRSALREGDDALEGDLDDWDNDADADESMEPRATEPRV
jgi:hypothetical protein